MVFGWVLAVWCNNTRVFWNPRNALVEFPAEVCAVVIVLALWGALAFLVRVAPFLVLLALLVLALLVLSIPSRRGVNPHVVWHGPH